MPQNVPETVDAVKGILKFHKIHIELSLPLCTFLDDVAENEDMISTHSSFSKAQLLRPK